MPIRASGWQVGQWINGLLFWGAQLPARRAQQPLCLQRLPEPINTLSPALITPLSAPNQANTSGEFKPLTSQKFLCNNRLSFWWFNSIQRGRPSGVARGCQGKVDALPRQRTPEMFLLAQALGDQKGSAWTWAPWACSSQRPDRSSSPGGQKSNVGLFELKSRCGQGWFLLDTPGENPFLAFPGI